MDGDIAGVGIEPGIQTRTIQTLELHVLAMPDYNFGQ
jgi:hypothetical protein